MAKNLSDINKDKGIIGTKFRNMRMRSKNPIGGIGVARDDIYRNEVINKSGMNEADTTIVAKAEKESIMDWILKRFK